LQSFAISGFKDKLALKALILRARKLGVLNNLLDISTMSFKKFLFQGLLVSFGEVIIFWAPYQTAFPRIKSIIKKV
jgi:hypothetical protein